MQSLIGVLIFCCYAVRWGRAFTRRLIDKLASVPMQTDSIAIDEGIRADIGWWIKFMKDWNGVSVLNHFLHIHALGENFLFYTQNLTRIKKS